MSKQDKGNEKRRRFVERLAFGLYERDQDTKEVRRENAGRDEDRHIQNTCLERVVRAGQENGAGPKDDRRRKDEKDPVYRDRCRKIEPEKVDADRGVEKNRYREDERNPKTAA